jgi:hypothetical protein
MRLILAGGEGLGVALDATGVGAIAGVPLNVVSAAGITAGAGITTAAMANIASHTGGDGHVSPIETDGTALPTGPPTPPRTTRPGSSRAGRRGPPTTARGWFIKGQGLPETLIWSA